MRKLFTLDKVSQLAGTMAAVFAILGSEFLLSKFGFNYHIFSDEFDLVYFLIEVGTLLILYFIGLNFFTWLYPKIK